jgi:hypothetical protein
VPALVAASMFQFNAAKQNKDVDGQNGSAMAKKTLSTRID